MFVKSENSDLILSRESHIDSLGVYDLLYKVRFGAIGDVWLQGDTGKYWMYRLSYLQEQDRDAYVQASKKMGWTR